MTRLKASHTKSSLPSFSSFLIAAATLAVLASQTPSLLLNSNGILVVEARRPSSGGGRAPPSSRRRSGSNSGSGRASVSSRSKRSNAYLEDEYDIEDEKEEDEMSFGFLDEEDEEDEIEFYDEELEEDRKGGRGNRAAASDGNSRRGSSRPSPRGRQFQEDEYYEEYDEDLQDDYGDHGRRGSASNAPRKPQGGKRAASASTGRNPGRSSSSSRSSASRGSSGSRRARSDGNVVPYGNSRSRRHQPQPSAFTRGLTALRSSIPDPATIKDTAFNSISAAKETTSKLTSNIYREVKGLTSSELEQVMLKATAPNDTAVKGKHVERLVGVTYQISGRYDIYDAVLRKLWSKMVENDWRTTTKALYILHRFSADGAPDHQAALKARLRELRRTRDPKRGKEKYFNSKQLLSGDTSPANIPFRAFLSRYAHYVLLRAQCFGGIFTEIANDPNKAKTSKSSKPKPKKCITSTCLKNEHLEAAQMLLKAGLACNLKPNGEEECENTAIALERVVADLIGLTGAVATALNNALKSTYDNDPDVDWGLVKKWCEFYSDELLVETKSLMKKTTPILDAFGLFLPSRIGTGVSQELLQKGLKGRGSASEDTKSTEEAISNDDEAEDNESIDVGEEEKADLAQETTKNKKDIEDEQIADEDAGYDEYDEYEYEEYDYEE